MCVCVCACRMYFVCRCIPVVGGLVGVRHPWRRILLGGSRGRAQGGCGQGAGGPDFSVGCFKTKKRSVGSVGHVDGLGTLRVACSHHAYTPYSSTK